MKKLEKELTDKYKQTKKAQEHVAKYYAAKQEDKETSDTSAKPVKVLRHDFTDIKVSNHFIIRAQERFGVRDLGNYEDNYKLAASWALNILKNYDTVEDDDKNNWLVTYKKIIIVYSTTDNTCVTCYPMSYSELNKSCDTLKTTLAKRELNLDELLQTKVDDTLRDLYYQEARKAGKVLTRYYSDIAKLYQEIANCKRNSSVDDKIALITENRSIIYDVEEKVKTLHDVVF